jgi:hypothetical protein
LSASFAESRLLAEWRIGRLGVQSFADFLEESVLGERFLDEDGALGQNAAMNDDVIGVAGHI